MPGLSTSGGELLLRSQQYLPTDLLASGFILCIVAVIYILLGLLGDWAFQYKAADSL